MTFLCSAQPEYGFGKKLKALEPHVYIQFQARAKSCNGVDGEIDFGHKHKMLPASQAALEDSYYLPSDLLMDSDEVEAWTSVGIKLNISRVKGLRSNARELQQTIFQVSVASVGLLQIQRVEVLEDVCTNELQRWLDKGWRLLAVCPPNDTRRPSYVLGHVDANAEG